MKISKFDTVALSIPFKKECVGGKGSTPVLFRKVNPVVILLSTEDGCTGYGYTIAFNDRQIKSLKASLDDLSDLVVGQDIYRWSEAWEKLWLATSHMGHRGYGIYALSAIDSAMWNLRAKIVGIPLAKLLGGYRDEVPVYANNLLWRNWSIDELQRDAAELVKQGFRHIKMNMGDKPMDIEIRRIQAVRESVGESVHILVDVNWGWTLSQAIQIGRKLQEYNVFWLEDPLASDDWDDVATLKNSLDLPIAAGESVCGKWEFRDFFMKRTADIPQIDLQYVGGVTEWMRVAGMAQAWNLPVASHVFHDFSVHLVAAAPNGLIVEYLPWWEEIYQEPLKIIDGKARISDKPGVGLDLNPDAIKKYSLS